MNKDEMMSLRQQDLIDNPATRLPVCLCLDTSGSMNRVEGGRPTGQTVYQDGRDWDLVEGGSPPAIEELKKGIKYFFEAIESDEVARYSAELAIVTFSCNASVALDFANIDRQTLPNLKANGYTAMGEGVNLALDILETRKKEYSDKGVDYYQPWLVLMTDGFPTDEIQKAVDRVQSLAGKKKLTCFAVAIGDGADEGTLKSFSTVENNSIIRVHSAQYFKRFFEWLSQSVAVTSHCIPGDEPQKKLPEWMKM